MKKYLVAGGAGFIGAHLCKTLLSKGKVFCIDNLQTGNKKNIKLLLSSSNFTFTKLDIRKTIDLSEKFDYVINLACPASPFDYRDDPIGTLETCSNGVKNLLDIALKNKARFIQASTSEVYGDPLEHPQKENYKGNVNSYGERSCYDEGKRFAESLIYYYRHDFGLNTGIVRIFNTYGPKMKPFDGRVVSTFIRQVLNNEEITVFGKGDQTRSFCYVSDLVNGLDKMIHSNAEGPLNLGNPQEFTVLELAKKVIKLTDSKSKIIYKDLPADDPTKRKPDITKAQKELGWQPEIVLEDGLKQTIEWFKKEK